MKMGRIAAAIGLAIVGGMLIVLPKMASAQGCCQLAGSCNETSMQACQAGGDVWHPNFECAAHGSCVPTPPRFARQYMAWMARAMDQCTTPTTTVLGGPTLPGGGCVQANSDTDDSMTMLQARLVANAKTGNIILTGKGFQFGTRVKAQLRLRVTKANQNTPQDPDASVTFEDVTVQCPDTLVGFPARVNGNLVGKTNLNQCGLPYPGLASGNIEILEAVLINADTGRVFARPGLRR